VRTTSNPRRVDRSGFTLIELLIVIAIIAILIGLLLPAVQKVRESASRAESTNNLKQLGLACRNFHTSYHCFPTNGSTSSSGTPSPTTAASFNVFYQILPFLEENALYQNPAVASATHPVIIKPFLEPGRGRKGYLANGRPTTDYAFNALVIRTNAGNTTDGGMSTDGITDGASNTILGGQKSIHSSVYTLTAANRVETDILETGNTLTNGTWVNNSSSPLTNTVVRGTCAATGSSSGTQPNVYAAYPHLVPDSLATPQATATATDAGEDQFGGPYSAGTLMLLCDGSVRLMSYNWGASTNVTPIGAGSVALGSGAYILVGGAQNSSSTPSIAGLPAYVNCSNWNGCQSTSESYLRAALTPAGGDTPNFE
jgi:prepilin-type N-terminal cleavage/methylation domain-containing protein